jgi:HD-like signal output (HDOD) protein
MKIDDIVREIDQAQSQGPLRGMNIQPCPAALTELRAEINKSDPSPQVVARIAGADVALAAALLRVANSPFYSRSRPTSTVSEAIALLGVNQTVTILTGILLRSSMKTQSPLLERFWDTSTRRALIMGFLAKQMYSVSPDMGHTFGLFSHVGIPIMMQGLKGYEATYVDAITHPERSFVEIENAAHRTDHAVVGAMVAKSWNMPLIITVATRLHHDFTTLEDSNIHKEARALIAMSLMAERILSLLEGSQHHHEWEQYGQACMDHLQVQQTEMDSWYDTLLSRFEDSSGI